ncbi:MAG: hypothetical protein ACRDSZ_17445 [Pseudonocardiaceae bacterium]
MREHGALAVVDARREFGPVSADYAVGVALRKVREYGAGIVGMINTQRYGILAPWSVGRATSTGSGGHFSQGPGSGVFAR